MFNQFTGYYTSLMENDPDAKIGIIGPLTGPDGTQGGTRISFPMDRGYYFSSTAQDLDGIMAFLNWSLTDGNDFRKWGVEGKTYTVDENGVKHSIPDTEREADWVSAQIEPLTFVHVPEDNFSWTTTRPTSTPSAAAITWSTSRKSGRPTARSSTTTTAIPPPFPRPTMNRYTAPC